MAVVTIGEESPREGAVVLTVAGHAGIDAVEALEQRLMSLAARRPPLVVIDLHGLEFISSMAMGALVAFVRGVSRRQCQVRFVKPGAAVYEAFTRAGLETVLCFVDSLEEGLGATATQPA